MTDPTPTAAHPTPATPLLARLELDRDQAEAVLVALEVRRISRRGSLRLRHAGRRVEMQVAEIVRKLGDHG